MNYLGTDRGTEMDKEFIDKIKKAIHGNKDEWIARTIRPKEDDDEI